MEKKNTGLKVLVAILIILVLGLSGYIVYDKVLKENDNVTPDNTTNETDNNQAQESKEENNIDIKAEVKNKFEFAFEYFNSVIAYCGTHETSDRVLETGNYYNVSTQFKTYEEMLNYLKGYMTEDVIASATKIPATNKDNYIEENDKLYCATFGKGNIYDYGDSVIEIESNENNKITATAMKELINEYAGNTYKKVKLTLEKIDNNYIITSYEVQD